MKKLKKISALASIFPVEYGLMESIKISKALVIVFVVILSIFGCIALLVLKMAG